MSKIVGLWPTQCCALQGNGLPRQCDHWLAMTGKILHSAPKIGALRNENRVIAREQSDRGNPFPGIRKDANARRAFQLHR
jgi:hypothetical protein